MKTSLCVEKDEGRTRGISGAAQCSAEKDNMEDGRRIRAMYIPRARGVNNFQNALNNTEGTEGKIRADSTQSPGTMVVLGALKNILIYFKTGEKNV